MIWIFQTYFSVCLQHFLTCETLLTDCTTNFMSYIKLLYCHICAAEAVEENSSIDFTLLCWSSNSVTNFLSILCSLLFFVRMRSNKLFSFQVLISLSLSCVFSSKVHDLFQKAFLFFDQYYISPSCFSCFSVGAFGA